MYIILRRTGCEEVVKSAGIKKTKLWDKGAVIVCGICFVYIGLSLTNVNLRGISGFVHRNSCIFIPISPFFQCGARNQLNELLRLKTGVSVLPTLNTHCRSLTTLTKLYTFKSYQPSIFKHSFYFSFETVITTKAALTTAASYMSNLVPRVSHLTVPWSERIFALTKG